MDLRDSSVTPAGLAPGASMPLPVSLEWRTSPGLTEYLGALDAMEVRVEAIRAGTAAELLWLLEHPPLYTAGTSADPAELLDAGGLPVHEVGRGGRHTYHGPGQRILYVMVDLKRFGCDLRAHVGRLEEIVIRTLADLGVRGQRREGRTGVWIVSPAGEAKIAAMGVRVRRWVTFHGLALNVDPDLGRFAGIVPCGIREHGVTSLHALGLRTTMDEVDALLHKHGHDVFVVP